MSTYAYAQKTAGEEPQWVVQVSIAGEPKDRVVAFSVFPDVGDPVILSCRNGDTEVLEVVGVTHWAREFEPGQEEIDEGFVDCCIRCERRSCTWLNERERVA